jgi:actin-like ATPase involved in cell morphogenesis
MSDPLGLSIGTTNLVAARVGNPPITRPSVLPLAGQVMSGFVERVGDPVPLVAEDGTSYRADVLVAEALDAMVVEAGTDPSGQIAVAVPAHWNGATLRSLRDAIRTKPHLAPDGMPVRLVSDAVAALTALGANPGLPVRGVVVLLDFGGGGTSITVADAAATFEPIETTRLTDFSGDQIDQSLLALVLDRIAGEVDPAGTAAVGSLSRLREECRRAKEELSQSSVVDVSVELPGLRSTIQVTRDELDALMDAPLSAVLAELDASLVRNRIGLADVSALVAAGGGARIPLVNRRLSEREQTPFVTTPHPALDAAVGAALFAAHGADAEVETGVAPTALINDSGVGADAAPGSSTFRALAWSQDDETIGEPEPYTGEDPYADPYADPSTTRVVAQYHPRRDDEPRSWLRLPQLILGVAAVIAVVAVGGVAIALTSATDETRPTPTTAPVTASPPPAPPPTSIAPPPPVTEAPPQNVVTVTSVAPPPPPPPTETVTVERPVTTITRTRTTTTTTTTTPTTTTTTTPTTTTTTPTTTTTTSNTPVMTTSYITLPFVPVPIPIQVPSTPAPYQPPAYQEPPYGQPQYGQPQYGQPPYGQPQFGQAPQLPY